MKNINHANLVSSVYVVKHLLMLMLVYELIEDLFWFHLYLQMSEYLKNFNQPGEITICYAISDTKSLKIILVH